MFDLILLGSIWIMYIVYYLILKKYADNKENILIGAAVDEKLKKDDDVKKITQEYYHSLKRITLIICIIPVPFMFIRRMSIEVSFLLMLFLVSIGIQKLPWIKGFKKLQLIKEKKNWSSRFDTNTFVDMDLANRERLNKKNVMPYIPAVIISFIPIVYEVIHSWGNRDFIMYVVINGTFAMTTLIFMVSSIIVRNMKNIVVSNVSAVNASYNRIRIYNLNKSFLIMAWVNTVYTLITWVALKQDSDIFFHAFLIVTIFYILFVLAVLLWSSFRIRGLQDQLVENYGKNSAKQVNDDSHWIWGMIYNNPNDSHSKVYSRMGIGLTPNIATSAGKRSILIRGMIIMIIPIICGWMVINEFTPLGIRVEQDAVIAEHINTEYKINIDDIENVQIIHAPLKHCLKLYGIGMEDLYKGYFKIGNYGKCDVCLNPNMKKFLFIQTYNDDKYIFSGSSDKEVQEIYDKLKVLVNIG